jgi:hypothetical protein
MEEKLVKDFERLDFDVDRAAPDPELAPPLVELAVGEPPDVAGRIAGVGRSRRIHGLSPSLAFLESSVRT